MYGSKPGLLPALTVSGLMILCGLLTSTRASVMGPVVGLTSNAPADGDGGVDGGGEVCDDPDGGVSG